MPATRTGKRRAPPYPSSSSSANVQPKRRRNAATISAASPPTSANTSKTSQSRRNLSQLPYHILLEIFLIASNKNFLHGWPDCAFLLGVATTCKNFYEPAIAALYRNPSTAPSLRAHQLLETLRGNPVLGRKIKHLVFEIDPLLRLSTPGFGHFDVAGFVRLCTGLKELWLAHPCDLAPYRWSGPPPPWKYPSTLFDALEGVPMEGEDGNNAPIRLQSWRWNGLFTGCEGSQEITRIHLQQSFQSLKRLSIIYLLDKQIDFIPALAVLPRIEELELECCNFTPETMSNLPVAAPNLRLKSLSFINCALLESDSFSLLLLSNICNQLEHLKVANCRSCNLEFLPALSNTPHLRSLFFDGKYFFTLFIHNSTKPTYEKLLPLSAVPVYPPTLHSLKLLNLRKWNSEEAGAFLDGLLSAAPGLSGIRELSLHCILDGLDWRERAAVRDKYESKLLHAFVRPPTTHTSDKTFKGTAEHDRVDVKIDNARPAETHFGEQDFLEFENSRVTLWTGRGRGRGRGRGSHRRVRSRGTTSSTSFTVTAAGGSGEGDSDEEYVD
ncbi:hypothetical protein BDD12DRAFT_977706 [Trichophaea hybrida]|nr:hypothetical protein BDD12DRAFT_977706 [Trichophaea hybrida]